MSWLKIEVHTPDKPEVFDIARQLGIHPDEVFGKCFRLWAWFDAHTTNGKTNGVSVSDLLVDRICGVKGFAESMWNAGWLDGKLEDLSVKNFDRHNGETAKTRAMTAKRVQKHANAKLTQNLTVGALPREEKRRSKPISENTDPRFDQFWSVYPKKKARGAAEKAWRSAHVNGDFDRLIEAVRQQSISEDWVKDGGKFIPHPATWISQKRWLDEIGVGSSSSPVGGAWI